MVLFSRSPRSVSPAKAREIFNAVGEGVWKVAVTHTSSEDEMRIIFNKVSPDAVQVFCHDLRHFPSNVKVIRAVAPGDPIPDDADALIIDSSHGKGVHYDEEFARKLVSSTDVPVVLAGGLSPENVSESIERVRPFAVDVASGVEEFPGKKDPRKVRDFIRIARGAKK